MVVEERQIIGLSRLPEGHLDSLLITQQAEWDVALDWDASKSAALVHRLAAEKRLGGAALIDHGEVAGFAYAGFDGGKGVIADVYVKPSRRTADSEITLFRALFDVLRANPETQRIVGQPMLLSSSAVRSLSKERGFEVFDRILMRMVCAESRPKAHSERFNLRPWRGLYHGAAAELIASAYRDHIDSRFSNH